jgi:hypothetical protein
VLVHCAPLAKRVVYSREEIAARVAKALEEIPEDVQTIRAIARYVGFSTKRFRREHPDLAVRLAATHAAQKRKAAEKRRGEWVFRMTTILRNSDEDISDKALLRAAEVPLFYYSLAKKARELAASPQLELELKP